MQDETNEQQLRRQFDEVYPDVPRQHRAAAAAMMGALVDGVRRFEQAVRADDDDEARAMIDALIDSARELGVLAIEIKHQAGYAEFGDYLGTNVAQLLSILDQRSGNPRWN